MRAGVLPVVFLVALVVTGGLMNIGVDTNICSHYWQSQSVLLMLCNAKGMRMMTTLKDIRGKGKAVS